MLRHTQACASLYIPAIHKDLLAIANGHKLQHVSSLIFCTEDAVTEYDLPMALQRLQIMLAQLNPSTTQQRLIRVRNPEVLKCLLDLPHIERIDGFVLPKVTAQNIAQYQMAVERGFAVMPTLETKEVFLESAMVSLRDLLLQDVWRSRTVCLRIGGNDLLGLLGMRRSAGHILYETVLGTHIDRLVGIFKPFGFELSAPVFEFTTDVATLKREVKADLLHGLTGKTVIHPDHVTVVESLYQITEQDILMAKEVYASKDAVFQSHERMQEPATHRAWAKKILESAGVAMD